MNSLQWINAIPAEYSNFRKASTEEHRRCKLRRRCFRQWNKTIISYLYQVGDKFYGKRSVFRRNFTVGVIDAEDFHDRKHKCWIIHNRHEYPSQIEFVTISIYSNRHGMPCGFLLNDSSVCEPLAIDLTEQSLKDGLTKIFSQNLHSVI